MRLRILLFFLFLSGWDIPSLPAQVNADSLRGIIVDETRSYDEHADALIRLIAYYFNVNQDSSQLLAEQFLSLAQDAKDSSGMMKAYQYLGRLHAKQGDYETALKYRKQALSASRKAGPGNATIYMLGGVGNVYMEMGDYPNALTYFQAGLNMAKDQSDTVGIAACLGSVALIYYFMGSYEQAIAHNLEAIDLFTAMGDSSRLSSTLINIGAIYKGQGKSAQALTHFLRALAINEARGDKKGTARVLNNIGVAYRRLGQADKAREYYQRSLKLAEELDDLRGVAHSLNNLGGVYLSMGDYLKAIDLYTRSFEIKESLGDQKGMASSLNGLGKIYKAQASYQEAISYFQRSIALCETIGYKMGIVQYSTNLAECYYSMGNDSLALALATENLALTQEMSALGEEGDAYILLGKIHRQKGESGKARQAFQQGLTLLDQVQEAGSQSVARISLAQLALEDQDWPTVYRYAKLGLAQAKEAGSASAIRDAAEMLWQSQQALGQPAAALESHLLYIQMRDSLVSEANQRATLQYEYDQKTLADSLQNAQQLAIQAAQAERRTTISYFLMGGLGVTILFGLLLYNRFRLTSRQKKIIEAEKGKLDLAYTELNQANEKLKELDDFKSRFFTNISHEFRTPLTVIGGMIQQVKTQPDKWLDKGSTLIERNVNNLLSLINQILDLRKLESGGLQLNPIQDDVVKFLRYGTESFESLASSRSVGLTFESELDQQLMDFDPEKLLQIQTNLISNAIKFTQGGGKVKVSIKKASDGRLQIQVADTGRGIPPEKLPHIFDRFYQVDQSDTREGEGTGIGLSLTQELVRLMKGEIQVESTVNQGSTFTVLLPITQAAPLQAAATHRPLGVDTQLMVPTQPVQPQAAPSNGERPSLLIIEDNPDIVEYLFACLDEQYELSSAADGQAGIEAALEQIPDIIITDVMMPRKNGYEVCETLKLDKRTSHIPIVMLTAKADQDSRLEGYKRGADAYLPKPFDQEELEIRLAKLLELRRNLQARYQGGQVPASSEDPAVQMEDAFITKARACILAHLDDSSYRGESLGQDLAMSRGSLHRKLKALTGLSTSHFIRSIKIEHAKDLLKDPEIQVAEVAYAVGFNDPAYFSRIFAQLTSHSPADWRKMTG